MVLQSVGLVVQRRSSCDGHVRRHDGDDHGDDLATCESPSLQTNGVGVWLRSHGFASGVMVLEFRYWCLNPLGSTEGGHF